MIVKYVLLDEISLEIEQGSDCKKIIFDSEKEAIKYAET